MDVIARYAREHSLRAAPEPGERVGKNGPDGDSQVRPDSQRMNFQVSRVFQGSHGNQVLSMAIMVDKPDFLAERFSIKLSYFGIRHGNVSADCKQDGDLAALYAVFAKVLHKRGQNRLFGRWPRRVVHDDDDLLFILEELCKGRRAYRIGDRVA